MPATRKKATTTRKKATTRKKSTARKKASSRTYSPAAAEVVHEEMHEFKEGTLHSGSPNGPVVTNPKQAIAIGLSEARREGKKVPANPSERKKRG